MTCAYLSIVSHDDQLHILGCRLGVAFMLQGRSERKCTGNRWEERRKDMGKRRGEGAVNVRGNRGWQKDEPRDGEG